MQRSSTLFLWLGAVVMVAVAALAYWTAQEPPPLPGPRVEPATVDAIGDPTAAPTGASPSSSGTPLPADQAASGPRVDVRVTVGERFVPPPEPPFHAVRKHDRSPLPAVLLAGAGAGFDGPARVAGVALASIDVDGLRIVRQVVVATDTAAPYEVAGPLAVAGTVRDPAGTPRPGAVVWFGEFAADGARREFVCDEEGRYHATVLAGTGVPFVVRADGCATAWRPVTVAAPPADQDLQLQPGCVLEVQAVGVANTMESARLFVVPPATVTTELAQWPFFEQVLTDGAALDAQGRAAVVGLPRVGDLGVLIRHPLASLREPATVVLKGERVRASVPFAIAAATWRGRVVDGDGQPLVGVAAWARSPGRGLVPGNSQRLLPPHLEALGTFAGSTDGDGTFTLGSPTAGDAVLSLRRRGFAGRDVRAALVTAGAPLVLPAWRGGEPQFTLAPPGTGGPWQVTCNLLGDGREAVAAGQGWRLSLPHAGRFTFVLTTYDGDAVVATRTEADVDVTGPIDLQPPQRP